MYFRCCRHCAEDPYHREEDVNHHAVPCGGGGPWAICSGGGDCWFNPVYEGGDVYNFEWED